MTWRGLEHELEVWARLPDDWDGYDGHAPASETINSARLFLDLAEASGVSEPCAQVAGDGEISYTWNPDRGFASVSFLSSGCLVGVARNCARIHKYDGPASDALMREVIISVLRLAGSARTTDEVAS